MSVCMICPRRCGIDRQTARGFCGVGEEMRIVRVMRHSFEEPCIAGEHGAGAIFFTGCNLGCVFCQNAPISHPAAGHEPGDTVSPRRLADIMLELQAAGLSSVDLVTPTHFTPRIAEALRLARMDGLSLPVVWNSGGYELTETLAVLDGLIDVYMPDFKYFSPAISQKYSAAADYADRAAECIGYMYRVLGAARFGDGMMTRGTLIRHLVLPGLTGDSIRILEQICDDFPGIPVSLMGQYTPCGRALSIPGMDRKIKKKEYARVLAYMEAVGLNGYRQELGSADGAFIPAFDGTGV